METSYRIGDTLPMGLELAADAAKEVLGNGYTDQQEKALPAKVKGLTVDRDGAVRRFHDWLDEEKDLKPLSAMFMAMNRTISEAFLHSSEHLTQTWNSLKAARHSAQLALNKAAEFGEQALNQTDKIIHDAFLNLFNRLGSRGNQLGLGNAMNVMLQTLVRPAKK